MRRTSKNQQGFTAIETVLAIVIVVIIGFIGWYAWHSKQSTDITPGQTSKAQSASSSTSRNESQADDIKKIDTVKLSSPSDVSKLPSYTPASFLDYMRQKLSGSPDAHGCGMNYSVDIISSIAIAGSDYFTSYSRERKCEGEGFNLVWYVDASGKWAEVGLEAACTKEGAGADVPSMFMQKAMSDTCKSFTYSKY